MVRISYLACGMKVAPGAQSPAEIVVGRYQGTVMVTVHGELDRSKADHLRLLLTDLIDGQGNVSVVIDLQDATAHADDPDGIELFAQETTRAHRHHAVVVVAEPSDYSSFDVPAQGRSSSRESR
jgi:anti-anti-sigma regulatory factor